MMHDPALARLLTWTSPSYPIGAFTYSHGLETAVADERVTDANALFCYVESVLAHGGGWADAVLFCHCWRSAGEPARFDEVAELANAFRGSAETALESRQQGQAFLSVTRRAWPHPALDDFAQRWAGTHPPLVAVFALACAVQGVPLGDSLRAYLHGVAANLVSAGVRLVPLGQTDGQIATARLMPVVDAVADRALVTELDDLGTSALLLDLASMHHETLYTRLFRS